MGINTAIDTVNGIVIRSVTGELKPDDIKEAWEKLMGRSDYRHDMNIIWDVRECDVSNLSSDNIRDLAYFYVKKTSDLDRKIKISVVVPDDLLTGLTRMFQAYAHESAFDLMAFRDLDQAIEWVRKDSKG
jgi:hypothetical protein